MSSYPEVNKAWSKCSDNFADAIGPMADLARSLQDELDDEREANDRLREALEFYATPLNWQRGGPSGFASFTPIYADNGQRARAALGTEPLAQRTD